MPGRSDLICLSHLRWDYVFQRPQHLMTRFARARRVFFVELTVRPTGGEEVTLELREHGGVTVVTLGMPADFDDARRWRARRALLARLLDEQEIERYVLWYYDPLAMRMTQGLAPVASVYDCMDDLSRFVDAPPDQARREAELLHSVDLVFTGGRSLFEAKRRRRADVRLFPSSVDRDHFAAARRPLPEPPDQARLRRPRLGYYGVIDERLDLPLLEGVAERRPDWQIVLVGPVAKIDPAALPSRPNVHLLGPKHYAELPAYLAGWDVALMPFARNEATRFISPTKTPEYLAGGRPVVSTPIPDVVVPYGEQGLVAVAEDVDGFVAAAAEAIASGLAGERLAAVDRFLAGMSWDCTFEDMDALVREREEARTTALRASRPSTVRA
jgi:UDP-galactopyranose mutase